MNASKTLTAAIAAATIIGTVGYVSAQTTTDPATTPQTQEMQQPSTATPPADTSTTPSSTGSMTTPSSTGSTAAPMPADSSTAPAPNAAPTNVPSSSSDMSTPAVTSDVNAAPAEPAPKADRN